MARSHVRLSILMEASICRRVIGNGTISGRGISRWEINILDGKVTKTPEIFNAYVEPRAFSAFEKTGIWPDGTQIVKEFSAVRIGDGCDERRRYAVHLSAPESISPVTSDLE